MPKTWCNREDREQARAVLCNTTDLFKLLGGTTPATPHALTVSS